MREAVENPEADVLAAIDQVLIDEPFAMYDQCRCGDDWHGLPKRDCPGAALDGPPLILTWKQLLARLGAETPVNWLGATDPHDCPRSFLPVAAHAEHDGVAVCVHVGELGMCAYVRVPEELASVSPRQLGGLGVTWQNEGLWGVDTMHGDDWWRAEDLNVFGVDYMRTALHELLADSPLRHLVPDPPVEPWTLEAMLGRALALAIPVAEAARYVRDGGEIDSDEPETEDA
ncbi:hypothetical protein [Nocardia ninae]|uniref:hypothetical protein n=1 Tax=Nocardia ninae TaxID=356145 RepID=UPI0011BEFE6D|nr:hypothetical protein [Nocardia ninae]